MSSKNQHITEYLDYYVNLKIAPEYAILLRGNWGVGKSWFIKNYIGEKGNFLYVSLYGISKTNEIEDAFFEQLHPVLASKGMKIAGKVLKGLVKATIKVDLNGNSTKEINVESGVPELPLPNYFKNLKDKIIVFDDLERCSIPIKNILGYINQFVEGQNLKVIIVANENEIKDKEEYKDIKEKLIGKSFDIQYDIEGTMDFFISEITNESVKKLLKNKKGLIIEIFTAAGYKNLRHLRQTILDFERFYDFLPEDIFEKNDLVEHIISLFFTISIELKKGMISEEDIPNLFIISLRFTEIEEKNQLKSIADKYSVCRLPYHPFKIELLQDFFKNGALDKDELATSIKNSSYYNDENTPSWKLLWNFLDLEDKQFNQIFNKVYIEYENLNISDKYILIHLIGLFLFLSDNDLITKKKDEIIQLARKNIQNLKLIGKLTVRKNERFPSSGHYGMGFRGMEIEEFKKIIEVVQKEIDIIKYKSYHEDAIALLRILSQSVDKFIDKVTFSEESDNQYLDIPILKYVPEKMFIETFLELSNKDKKLLGWQFENRYRYISSDVMLLEELQWLEEVHNKLTKEKISEPISNYITKEIFLKSLAKCIDILKTESAKNI